jgi:hypothetical protein
MSISQWWAEIRRLTNPMPPIESGSRYQKAVYWPPGRVNAYGKATLQAPVELDVRWEHGSRQGVDLQGNTVSLEAQAVVGEPVAIDGLMWLGTLAEWNSTGSTGTNMPLRIITYGEVPDIKGLLIHRVAGLGRAKDTAPQLPTGFKELPQGETQSGVPRSNNHAANWRGQ